MPSTLQAATRTAPTLWYDQTPEDTEELYASPRVVVGLEDCSFYHTREI